MNNSKEETKHKFSAQCMNQCIEWKLNAYLTYTNNSIGYLFNGKSLFFKHLDASILNVLQNSFLTNQNQTTKHYIKAYAEQSQVQLKEQKNSDKMNDNGDDILHVKFPIDNSEFNFMIIDSNLGIAENLKNIFFLEFDLVNSTNNKDQLKLLKDINNECVEREILFTLNGKLHGTSIFTSDLKFSVEYRKFIKSMQFRLEKYKHEIMEKKKFYKKHYISGGTCGVKNTFYTKILSNINLGIEFYKPNFSDSGAAEIFNFPTNFNSIVNSNISIVKLFLEVSIPKIFINNGLTLSVAHNKKTIGLNQDITAIDHLQIHNKQNDIITTYDKEKEKEKISGHLQIHVPKVIHQPPIVERCNSSQSENDFNRMKIMKNILRMDQNESTQKCFSPELSINKVPPQMKINPSGNPSGAVYGRHIPFTSLSPTSIGFHLNNGQNTKTFLRTSTELKENENAKVKVKEYSLYPRRFSESTFDKLKDNPLSQLSGMKINSGNNSTTMSRTMSIIGSPQMYMKLNPETMYNFNIVNSFKQNLFGHQEESNQTNSPGTCQNNQSIMILKLFTSYHEGLCNFLIFLRSCTPYLNKQHSSFFKSTTLEDFFKCFTRTSIFGLEVSYLYDNEIINTTYSCTLSSMEIVITDQEALAIMLDKLKLKHTHLNKYSPEEKASLLSEEAKTNQNGYAANYNEYPILNINQNFYFKMVTRNSKTSSISIEFYETKPPHLRPILVTQLEQLFKGLEALKEINIIKIDSSSWFSLLWTPYKSTKGNFMNTSFLTYYQFYNSNYISDENSSSCFSEIPIIGILPIKFENKLFLPRINGKNHIGVGYCGMQGLSIYPQFNENSHNNLVFKSSIDNVHNIVIKNCRKSSIDYEFYLKNSLSSIVN